MEINQALNLIKQVTAIYKGTLEEHTALQQAIKIIEDALKPKEDKEKK